MKRKVKKAYKMKKWNELTELGKKRRLSKIYGMLDPETSDKIFEKYNSIDERYDEDDLNELASMIRKENHEAGHFNSREYNHKITELLG